MAQTKTIELRWMEPETYLNLINNAYTWLPGVYTITKTYAGNTKTTYIGITINFKTRFGQHTAAGEKIKNLGPSTKISMAPVLPFTKDGKVYRDILEDIESILIYAVEPHDNVDKKYSCNLRSNLNIILKNTGYRIPGIPPMLNGKDIEKMSKENPRERPKTVSKQYKPLEYELRWDW